MENNRRAMKGGKDEGREADRERERERKGCSGGVVWGRVCEEGESSLQPLEAGCPDRGPLNIPAFA